MPRSKLAAAALALMFFVSASAARQASAAEEAASAAAPASSPAVIEGRGIVVVPATLMKLVLKQHPNSYTGGLTTVEVRMGERFRDRAVETFEPRFSDGVISASVPEAGAYNITLRLDGFGFKYDQLSTLGMAVSPRVNITVTADVTDPSGTVIVHKAYKRLDYSAGAYVISFKPRQKVLACLDKALDEIFSDMATDIAAAVPPVVMPEPVPVQETAEPLSAPDAIIAEPVPEEAPPTAGETAPEAKF